MTDLSRVNFSGPFILLSFNEIKFYQKLCIFYLNKMEKKIKCKVNPCE